MYAIMGITGQVGGALARTLLVAKRPVRAVARDANKGAAWAKRGCVVAIADVNDAPALTAAFTGAKGVFVLIPPLFDPTPGYPEVRAIVAALKEALEAARPAKVVCLSTIGALATQPNLLNQLGIMEQVLGRPPVAFLRAGWFMENSAWDVVPALETGVIPSFLQPLNKPVPMVATADIGRVAAELLREHWSGRRIVELEGPHRISPNEIAVTFSKVLGRPVRPELVPRDSWEALFASQGMKNPAPRIQMLDGFNAGWIEFDGGEAGSLKGKVDLEEVLKGLVERQSAGKVDPL
jgi:NAD(P)H dehydrogenase (quinone)